jgi:integrase
MYMKGYFRKRGSAWSFTIDLGPDPVTGKRRQKARSGFPTKRAAEQACAELIFQLSKGKYVEEKNITVSRFVEDWITEYKSLNDVKPSSVRQRQYQIRYLIDRMGALQLKTISRKLYQTFLIELHDHGFARTTLQNAHSCYKLIFARAVEQELIAVDPTLYAKLPKKKTSEEEETELPRYMEKEELMSFLRTADTFPDITGLAFWTMAYTGLRIGELCVLQWRDIDFEAGTLSVRRTLFNPDDLVGSYQTLTPKTKTSRRTISIDKNILDRLEAHRKTQKETRMRFRSKYHYPDPANEDTGFIFAREEADFPGYPIVRRLLEYRIKKVLKVVGLPTHYTPHTLRHTHTSLLAECGVPIEETSERLGHKNDVITRRIYLHVTQSVKRDSAEKFSALMASVSKM